MSRPFPRRLLTYFVAPLVQLVLAGRQNDANECNLPKSDALSPRSNHRAANVNV